MMDLADVLVQIESQRAGGAKVVMTNGCFDMFHAGHLSCLAFARGLGSHLLVCVNTDQSIARLKGEDRPVVPLADRMAILSALRCVDWVVPFGDENDRDELAHIARHVRPFALVKGGDYPQASAIAGAAEVLSAGGTIHFSPLLADRSTTNLIAKVRNASPSDQRP